MPSTEIGVEVASDRTSIEALEHDWRDLESRTPEATGFQSYNWCRTWVCVCENLGKSAPKPRVIVVREGRRVVFLLPLQIERRFGLRWARGLGQPLTQYADALAEESQSRSIWFQAIEAELSRLGEVDTLSMVQVRSDSVLMDAQSQAEGHKVSGSALSLSLLDPLSVQRAVAFRRTMRRRLRGLQRVGAIILDAPKDPSYAASALVEALDLKAALLASKGTPRSTFTEPHARKFLEELVLSGDVIVYRLSVGGRLAAIDIGLIARRSYRSLISAYDSRLSFGAPGHVLTRLLVQHLQKSGFTEFDLLGPVEPYKQEISNESVALISLNKSLTALGHVGTIASLHLRPPLTFVRDIQQEVFLLRKAFTQKCF